METNEAAAALLNMESPNNILDEKRMSEFIFTGNILLFSKMVQNIFIFGSRINHIWSTRLIPVSLIYV